MKQAQSQKLQSYLQLLLLVAIVVVINVIAQFAHERLDLTSNNRYTLSPKTIEKLKGLDDIVYAKVYLGSQDLPAGFRRLKESTREMLNEMKAYAGEKLQYEFIDPTNIEDPEERRDRYKQLSKQGLEPVNLQIQKESGSAQQVIFPGAILFYKDKTSAYQILQDQRGRQPQEVIHNSIMNLEYGLMNTVRKLRSGHQKRIAFVTGHGELGKLETKDIRKTLSETYTVKRLELPAYKIGALRKFDLAVIAKPTERLTPYERYKIDQFIMRGGKVLWLVDRLRASVDSLSRQGVGMSQEYQLDLKDQLFNYGVRINPSLVQDLQSHVIPTIRRGRTNQPQRSFLPWPYYPLVTPKNQHPIVAHLSRIWFRFANPIDTIATKGVNKTILLQSSPNSRTLFHPVRINMQNIRKTMKERLYRAGPQNLAVLLKGRFTSAFKNRVSPEVLQSKAFDDELKERSDSTKMIVVSDGDLIRNQVHPVKQKVYELGKDRFTKTSFANKTFILNCIDYLLDESGLMALRAKDYKLRMLDQEKANQEKRYWRVLNMGAPVGIVILFGLIFNFIRRQRFVRLNQPVHSTSSVPHNEEGSSS
jgi:ABC-2 type transport system permease protein